MIVRFQILAVVLCLYCQAFGDPFNSEEIQVCIDFCKNCNGKMTTENGKCECAIEGDVDKGAECMKRMAKESEQLGVIFEAPDSEAAEGRSVRSLMGLESKLSLGDVQRVAQYFMNGGPLTGSPLKQPCDPNEKIVGASKSTLKEPYRTLQIELPRLEMPNLPPFESRGSIIGAARENPWCPASILGRSQSLPVQPIYSEFNGIMNAPQPSPVTPQEFVEKFNPQPFLDIAQAIGRIQVPFIQTQNVLEDSHCRSNSLNPSNNIVGVNQVKTEVPITYAAKKSSVIVGAPKKATSQIIGASKNCEIASPPQKITTEIVDASKKTQDMIVGTPKKAIKLTEIVGAPKKTISLAGAVKNDCEDPGSNVGVGLSVSPAFTYPQARISYSTPQISVPQRPLCTINDLMSNALGRIQIPQYQVAVPRQRIVGTEKSGSDSNNQPNVLEITGGIKPQLLEETELQLGGSKPQVGSPISQLSPSSLLSLLAQYSWVPQALGSLIEVFQPLVAQSRAQVDTAVKNSAKVGTEAPQIGLSAPQMNLRGAQVRLALPQIGLGLPPSGLTTPQIGLDLSKLGFAPQMNLRVPPAGLNAPQIGLGLSRIGLNLPQIGLGIPQFGLAAPEMNLDVPRFSLAPQLGLGIPQFGSSAPQMDLNIPRFGLASQLSLGIPPLGLAAPQISLGTPRLGLTAPQMDLGIPPLGLSAPQMNLGLSQHVFAPQTGLRIPSVGLTAPQMGLEARLGLCNNPIGLTTQFVPTGYIINSPLSLSTFSDLDIPTLTAPRLSLQSNYPHLKETFDNELKVGEPRQIGQSIIEQCRIGSSLTRPRTLAELSGQSLRNKFGVTMRKYPREANMEFPEYEDIIASELIRETSKKSVETPVEMEKPLDKILERKTEKTVEKPLEKPEDTRATKIIEGRLIEKSVEKVPEQISENITSKEESLTI